MTPIFKLKSKWVLIKYLIHSVNESISESCMFENLVLNQLDLNQNRMNLSKIVNHQKPIRTVEYDFKSVLNVGMTHIVWVWRTSGNHMILSRETDCALDKRSKVRSISTREEFKAFMTQWVGNSRWKFCTWNDAHQMNSSKPLPSTKQFYSSHDDWNVKWLKGIVESHIRVWYLVSG